MAKAFRCRVITPEARLLDEEVTSAIVPLHDGQMGFLADRAPIVGRLGLGELRLQFTTGGARSYVVDDGFVQMVGNRLTILAGKADPAESISEQDAAAELAEAQARRTESADDRQRVNRDIARARAKMTVAKAFRARGGGI